MPTGQPHFFRCTRCNRRQSMAPGRHPRNTQGAWGEGGFAKDCVLTGRKRETRSTFGGNMDRYEREYRCSTCGHVGWSRHPQLRDHGKKDEATP